MKAIPHVAVSITVTALIAVSAYAGTAFLTAAVVLAVVAVALGWGTLVALPHPVGSSVVVAASGLAAVVTADLSRGEDRPLAPFAVLLALSVLVAFGHELMRRDGRPRLVESVTGTFAGQAVAVLGAGWLLLPQSATGVGGVAVAAAAAAAARLSIALPWPLRITGWIAIAAGGSFAALAATVVPDVPVLPGAVLGACVGLVVAALDRLLSFQPAAASATGMLAAACAPVVAAGTTAYAVSRILLG